MVEEKWGRTEKTGASRSSSCGVGRVGVVGTDGGVGNSAVKAVIDAFEAVLVGVDVCTAVDPVALRAARTPAIF